MPPKNENKYKPAAKKEGEAPVGGGRTDYRDGQCAGEPRTAGRRPAPAAKTAGRAIGTGRHRKTSSA